MRPGADPSCLRTDRQVNLRPQDHMHYSLMLLKQALRIEFLQL